MPSPTNHGFKLLKNFSSFTWNWRVLSVIDSKKKRGNRNISQSKEPQSRCQSRSPHASLSLSGSYDPWKERNTGLGCPLVTVMVITTNTFTPCTQGLSSNKGLQASHAPCGSTRLPRIWGFAWVQELKLETMYPKGQVTPH